MDSVKRELVKVTELALIGVLAGSFSAASNAGDDVDELRSIPPDSLVRIHNTRGELYVTGWDRDEARVEGELDDLAEGLQFEVDGDQVLIRVTMPDRDIDHGDGSDLAISLPAGVQLQIESVSSDIKLRGFTGAVAIRTVSGDVAADEIGALTHVNTMSGDITLSDGNGSVKVMTTSGDVDVSLSASDISVDSVSGDVDLELESFDSVKASTVSGELEIEGSLNLGGSIESRTVSGDIDLRLEEPVNANIDIRTGPGGEIDNELTDEEPRSLLPGSMELLTTMGDGSGSIRINTVSGEIRLDGH
jgi:hypothetical protein